MNFTYNSIKVWDWPLKPGVLDPDEEVLVEEGAGSKQPPSNKRKKKEDVGVGSNVVIEPISKKTKNEGGTGLPPLDKKRAPPKSDVADKSLLGSEKRKKKKLSSKDTPLAGAPGSVSVAAPILDSGIEGFVDPVLSIDALASMNLSVDDLLGSEELNPILTDSSEPVGPKKREDVNDKEFEKEKKYGMILK